MLKLVKFVRRLLAVFFCLGMFFGFVNGAAAAEPAKIIRVGVYDNKPKIYQSSDGAAAGLFADILKFIAQKENWKLQYVFGTWEQGLSRLEKGEIDIMVDVAVSEDRAARFDFTGETVFSSWGVIYVRKDSEIDSFLELEGKRVAILKSSIYSDEPGGITSYLKAFGLNTMIMEVDNYTEVFDFLEMGLVDAAVVSRVYGLTNRQGYQNLEATDLFFKPTELRFALTKGDRDNAYLIEKLDYWVKKLKDGEEGYYQQTLKRYGLLEPEPKPAGVVPPVEEILPRWGLPFGLGAAAGLLLSRLAVILSRPVWGAKKRRTVHETRKI